jgi:hypothetical protein
MGMNPIRNLHAWLEGQASIAKWPSATAIVFCRAHLILLAPEQKCLLGYPLNCTYLLLTALIARPLHSSVPPRMRAPTCILSVLSLVVARSWPLEGLAARTDRAVRVRKLDSLRPRGCGGHGKH